MPTGIDVKFDDLNLCDASTKHMDIITGGLAGDKLDELVGKARKSCPCLAQLPGFLSKFSLADSKTAAVAGAGQLFDCLVNAGFDVKNNSAEIEQSLLSEADGDKIIRAPELGMALYTSMAGAVGGCVFGATCDTIIGTCVER